MTARHVSSFKTVSSILFSVLALALGLLPASTPAYAEAPANDDFDAAKLITTLPYTQTIDTSTATVAVDDPDCYDAGATVWYSFTPSRHMLVGVNTDGSDYLTSVSAYAGTRGSLTPLGCAPPAAAPLQVWLEAGVIYHFMIGSAWNAAGGTLSLSFVELEPALNDDIENATAIATLPYEAAVDFSLATRDVDDSFCGCGPTVWYTYTPASTKRLTLTAEGSDSAVSVYSGAPGSLTPVACQYLHYDPSLEVVVKGGETYYIMLASAWYDPGEVNFLVESNDLFLPVILKPIQTP